MSFCPPGPAEGGGTEGGGWETIEPSLLTRGLAAIGAAQIGTGFKAFAGIEAPRCPTTGPGLSVCNVLVFVAGTPRGAVAGTLRVVMVGAATPGAGADLRGPEVVTLTAALGGKREAAVVFGFGVLGALEVDPIACAFGTGSPALGGPVGIPALPGAWPMTVARRRFGPGQPSGTPFAPRTSGPLPMLGGMGLGGIDGMT